MDLSEVARAWRDAGVRLLQYRDKTGTPETVLRQALQLRRVFEGSDTFLILNDYAGLAAEAGFDGAHLGQADGSVERVRAEAGANLVLGRSTHSVQEAELANREDVDYVAIGPVFPTWTKVDASPVVGVAGVNALRAAVTKPLVAIGGIDLGRAREMVAAGVESVAVISGLLPPPGERSLEETARDFLQGLQ